MTHVGEYRMNRPSNIVAIVAVMLLAAPLAAGTYNKQLNIGDAAPDWKGLVGTDDKKHSLADLADKQVIVVCFTCNTCPYAVDYEDRLIALAKRYLDDAVAAALAGKLPAVPETPAIGCAVRYVKERK